MMEAIASFAASDAGQFHALVSHHYGVDPAAHVSDPIVAANLRAALFVVANREHPAVSEAYETADGRRVVTNPGLMDV